jgi:hypothetical protein
MRCRGKVPTLGKHVARQGTNTGMSVAPAGQRSARRDRTKEARTLM